MKHIIIILITFFSFSHINSQIDYEFKVDDNGKVYFDEVIEVPNMTKNDLFIKGKDWFSLDKFTKGRKKDKGFWMETDKRDHGQILVDFEDKEDGKIYGAGRTNILVYDAGIKMNGGSFVYRVSLFFKDGKTRIIIDNLLFESGEMVGVNSGAMINEDYPKVFRSFGKNQIKKQWDKMRLQTIKELEDLISDYKEFITKKDIKSTDW